jgi:hypothetical protein
MTAAFGTRPKRRLNRVLDAIGFEYPDYGRLGGDVGGPKRKRIASAVDEESTKVAKKKKEIYEKLSLEKLSPEPKVAAARKRKTASPEPKTLVREEDTPTTPSVADVEEIMKVMTEPLPVKLSPLAPELTKFFQKDKAASAEEGPALWKKMKNYSDSRCDSSDAATGDSVESCFCRDRRSKRRRSRSYQGGNPRS